MGNDNDKIEHNWQYKTISIMALIASILLIINGSLMLLFTLIIFYYSYNVLIIGSILLFFGLLLLIAYVILKTTKIKMVIDIPKQKNIEQKVDKIIKKVSNEMISETISMKVEGNNIFIIKINNRDQLTIWGSFEQSIDYDNYSIAMWGLNKNNLHIVKIIQNKLRNELHYQKLI